MKKLPKNELVQKAVGKLRLHSQTGLFVNFTQEAMFHTTELRDFLILNVDGEVWGIDDHYVDDNNSSIHVYELYYVDEYDARTIELAISELFDVRSIEGAVVDGTLSQVGTDLMRSIFVPLSRVLDHRNCVVSIILIDVLTEAMLETKGYYLP